MSKIIIGLGTGRSGTQSLANLLNIPHQGRIYNWHGKDKIDFEFLEQYGGDVGNYYLNYVEEINERFGKENVFFVCVFRDRKSTTDSFKKILRESGVNPFAKKFLPKIAGKDLPEQIDNYYDDYYKISKSYEEKLSNFKIFSLEELNSPTRIKWFVGPWKYNVPIEIKSYCQIFS
jgi:hypothetical protein